ncbi:hypothetical protein G9A89_010015 [Geosiphon pyriformis]|nr:hypothetical protein G9A89_010015 [Geosiphon pyriformis]
MSQNVSQMNHLLLDPHLLKNTYIILRHGHSKANEARLVVSKFENGVPSNGVGPSNEGWGLTTLGKQQVLSAAQSLYSHLDSLSQKYSIDYGSNAKIRVSIHSSPFLRAVETGNIVHRFFKSKQLLLNKPENSEFLDIDEKIIINNDLKERDFGEFELKPDMASYLTVWDIDNALFSRFESNQDKQESDLIDHKLFGDLQDKYKELSVERFVSEIEKENFLKGNDKKSNFLNEQLDQKRVIVFISHGDSLQILQTAFAKFDNSTIFGSSAGESTPKNLFLNAYAHRKLKHLQTAEWRVLEWRN